MHSSKYYHLIKTLRKEQDLTIMKKRNNLHQHQLKPCNLTQQSVSGIIDHDNLQQLHQRDLKVVSQLQKLQSTANHQRLWQWYLSSSQLYKISKDKVLPLQLKLAQAKDQHLIDTIFQSTQELLLENTSKIAKINKSQKQKAQQIYKTRQLQKQYTMDIQFCGKQLIKLKQNYDRQEKIGNQRSNKYREQKSKDFMIKNINKEDNEMRKIMVSRIKLNQEMDLGFQIQRKREFNQSKNQINQKKKLLDEKLKKAKQVLANELKLQQKIIKQRLCYEKQNEIINQQLVYFIKKIVKQFSGHSRGIQWLVRKLQEMNVELRREDWPEDLCVEDKIFLEQLFKLQQQNIDKKMRMKMKIDTKEKRSLTQSNKQITVLNIFINSSRSNNHNLRLKTTNITPKTTTTTRPKFFTNIKTEPNLPQQLIHDILDPQNHPPSPSKHKASKSNHLIHFDIDTNESQGLNFSRCNVIQSTNIIKAKSCKKIYEDTSFLISNFIRNRDWDDAKDEQANGSQLKKNRKDEMVEKRDTRGGEQEQVELVNWQKRMIQDKLKNRFMNVRHKQRRNNLKKLLFGVKKI